MMLSRPMIITHWTGVMGVTVASARAARDITIPIRKKWNNVNDALANKRTGQALKWMVQGAPLSENRRPAMSLAHCR